MWVAHPVKCAGHFGREGYCHFGVAVQQLVGVLPQSEQPVPGRSRQYPKHLGIVIHDDRVPEAPQPPRAQRDQRSNGGFEYTMRDLAWRWRNSHQKPAQRNKPMSKGLLQTVSRLSLGAARQL